MIGNYFSCVFSSLKKGGLIFDLKKKIYKTEESLSQTSLNHSNKSIDSYFHTLLISILFSLELTFHFNVKMISSLPSFLNISFIHIKFNLGLTLQFRKINTSNQRFMIGSRSINIRTDNFWLIWWSLINRNMRYRIIQCFHILYKAFFNFFNYLHLLNQR